MVKAAGYRRQTATMTLEPTLNGSAVSTSANRIGFQVHASQASSGPTANSTGMQSTELYYRSLRFKTIFAESAHDHIVAIWLGYYDNENINNITTAELGAVLPASQTDWRELLEGGALGGTSSTAEEPTVRMVRHKICPVPASNDGRTLRQVCETVIKNVHIAEGRGLFYAITGLMSSATSNSSLDFITYMEAEYHRRSAHDRSRRRRRR